MEKVGWFSIRELAEIHSLVQMWKVVNLDRPAMIRDKLTITQDHLIEVDIPRLQFTLQSFT